MTQSGFVQAFMVLDWVKSEAARKAISYLADPRPAWLWSKKGDTLLWHNPAARLFRAKQKRHGLKLAANAVPIKGQVARSIRLGSPGRASLSRMQFLAGKKPVSATCTCTPLRLEDGTLALLIVAVDPIDKELFSAHGMTPEMLDGIFGETDFVIVDDETILAASNPDRTFDSNADEVMRVPAGPAGVQLVLLPDAGDAESEMATEADEPLDAAPSDNDVVAEELLHEFSEAAEAIEHAEEASAREDDAEESGANSLSLLVDKLVDSSALYTPLGPEDDDIPEGLELHEFPAPEQADATRDTVDDDADDSEGTDLWRIVGRDFTATDAAAPPPPSPAQMEAAEHASRYNFEELSRILNDRVGGEREQSNDDAQTEHKSTEPAAQNTPAELFSLSDETLVLNRLPIGLLIFRDQQILFANRTLTELVGYPDSTSLRVQGISAISPYTPASCGDGIGPVTQLAHSDGSLVPVSARLQTITWQGKAAFMLSAKRQDVHLSTEGAVRSFAESMATLDGSGFFETSRAGIIDSISGRAAELLGRSREVLIGRPLILLASHDDAAPLRAFLEHPARYADTARPSLTIRGIDPKVRILLFAEGQAGIVTGYFGMVQRVDEHATSHTERVETDGVEPSILKRLSRGMRRPLNTIIGFSELIRGNAFGPIENQRYVEYARDIKTAGQEILHVVDELEEFIRLHTGEYDVASDEIDLSAVLDKSMARVRKQAGEARVLVRSAISERLPHIRADEPSLTQAILNLLASAIDQTPEGGQVVLSAQREPDGAIAIHVRDSGAQISDLAERFVVFRDGEDQNGDVRKPIQSSVGLVLTRSLLAVNTCSLTIDPTAGSGTLLSLMIPGELAIDKS